MKKKECKILDSGKRQLFNTGAVRDTNEGKGDYSLLPTRAIRELAIHFQEGAKKYNKSNYKKGIYLSRYVDSAKRHLDKYLEGWTDEPHLRAAAWNIMVLIETAEMIKEGVLPEELDDLFLIQTGYTKEEYKKLFNKIKRKKGKK